jgi:hypothetical protein
LLLCGPIAAPLIQELELELALEELLLIFFSVVTLVLLPFVLAFCFLASLLVSLLSDIGSGPTGPVLLSLVAILVDPSTAIKPSITMLRKLCNVAIFQNRFPRGIINYRGRRAGLAQRYISPSGGVPVFCLAVSVEKLWRGKSQRPRPRVYAYALHWEYFIGGGPRSVVITVVADLPGVRVAY